MTDSNEINATVREIVAHFANRTTFDAAVATLLESGFDRADLSVLATHDSLAVTEGQEGTLRDALIAVLGEWKVEVPLIASGAILLAGGPIAVAVAGIIGATVGGIAVKEVVEEVTAQSHSEEFIKAVEAGNIVLWVRIADAERGSTAQDILRRMGGSDVHLTDRNHQQD